MSRKHPGRLAIAGAASVCTGLVLVPFALSHLLVYLPDPGTEKTGWWLAGTALALIVIPVATGAAILAGRGLRQYLAWKRTLTPARQMAVTITEIALLEAAHLAFREHNRKESARLTASVMGEDDDDPWGTR